MLIYCLSVDIVAFVISLPSLSVFFRSDETSLIFDLNLVLPVLSHVDFSVYYITRNSLLAVVVCSVSSINSLVLR